MWKVETIEKGRALGSAIHDANDRLTFDAFLTLLDNDAEFRAFFAAELADAPFGAYRWETPPVTTATLDRSFEYVLLDCPMLERPIDTGAFADQFATAAPGETALSFRNLSGDAEMVVPTPIGAPESYGHLAAFIRRAPTEQVDALWQLVSATVRRKLTSDPLWLSTAGMGVSWLHVRLDSTPKYYGHSPYRQWPSADDRT